MADQGQAQATFAQGKPRSRVIELEWPIQYEGRTYASLTVRRVTTQDIADWAEAVSQKAPDAQLKNVVDDTGAPVPPEVLDALDPDDDEVLAEAINDFLPRRLRAALGSEPEASTMLSSGSPEKPTPESPSS